MDITNLNTKNFVEPTERYISELKKMNSFKDNTDEDFKLWFNGDMIQWAFYYKAVKKGEKKELNSAYKSFCDVYNVKITPKKLKELFDDYSTDDYSKLVKFLLHNNVSYDNETCK